MPMRVTEVLGFTTEAIHAAAALVGDGGTVEFPRGVYDSAGLQVMYPNQTWIGERGTIIRRGALTLAPLLTVGADNIRLRNMEMDGNRYINKGVSPGISVTGKAVDMEWVDLHSITHWGLSISDAPLRAVNCQFRKTGQAGIFWRITAIGVSRAGPHIEYCQFIRPDKADYTDSGCLVIAGQATKRVIAPRVMNNRMVCYNPVGRVPNNSGGVGIVGGSNGSIVTGNEVIGGRIGISFGDGDYATVVSNPVSNCSSYAVELAGNSCDNSVLANPINTCGTGVEISGTSARNKIIGNSNHGCKIPVRDGAGPAYHNLIYGN